MPKSKLPCLQVNGQLVAVFKDPKASPYGGFANTTPLGDYNVKQTVDIHGENYKFVWPSSEQAYHAQKIIHLMKKLDADDPMQQALDYALGRIEKEAGKGKDNEFLPFQYEAIINNMIDKYPEAEDRLLEEGLSTDKIGFDAFSDSNFHYIKAGNEGANAGEPYTMGFMREVLRLKIDQHDDLRDIAIQMARDGIIPVEYSSSDTNWASGPNGEGLNMLGVLILEEGNRLLEDMGEVPRILNPPNVPNPRSVYYDMQEQNRAALAYANLDKIADEMKPQEIPIQKTPKQKSAQQRTPQSTPKQKTPQQRTSQPNAAKNSGNQGRSSKQNWANYSPSQPFVPKISSKPSVSSDNFSKDVSHMIRVEYWAPDEKPPPKKIPAVCQGAMGTLKIAFDSSADAEKFLSALNQDGLQASYYGDQEQFPMKVDGKKLGHIVRFEPDSSTGKKEMPPEALKFLNEKYNNDEKRVAEIAKSMGFEMPEPQNDFKRGRTR